MVPDASEAGHPPTHSPECFFWANAKLNDKISPWVNEDRKDRGNTRDHQDQDLCARIVDDAALGSHGRSDRMESNGHTTGRSVRDVIHGNHESEKFDPTNQSPEKDDPPGGKSSGSSDSTMDVRDAGSGEMIQDSSTLTTLFRSAREEVTRRRTSKSFAPIAIESNPYLSGPRPKGWKGTWPPRQRWWVPCPEFEWMPPVPRHHGFWPSPRHPVHGRAARIMAEGLLRHAGLTKRWYSKATASELRRVQRGDDPFGYWLVTWCKREMMKWEERKHQKSRTHTMTLGDMGFDLRRLGQ